MFGGVLPGRTDVGQAYNQICFLSHAKSLRALRKVFMQREKAQGDYEMCSSVSGLRLVVAAGMTCLSHGR